MDITPKTGIIAFETSDKAVKVIVLPARQVKRAPSVLFASQVLTFFGRPGQDAVGRTGPPAPATVNYQAVLGSHLHGFSLAAEEEQV